MEMNIDNKRIEFIKILNNLEGKSGYGKLVLTPDGVKGSMGKRKLFGSSYLALWELNGERHFLGRTPTVSSFDPKNESEVKKASVLIRNTEKAQRAYITTTTDINDPGKQLNDPNFVNSYQCLTDNSNGLSFFSLLPLTRRII